MAGCARCNRPLRDPESIRRGFGPVCWKKGLRQWWAEDGENNRLSRLPQPLTAKALRM